MEEKRISIKEIADIAGVSVATVSRVINGNGRFSEETRARVCEVIKEYGYSPNQLARSLRTNHTQVIGIIVPDITNEFFASVSLQIQENLLKYGYSTIICNTNEDLQVELKHISLLNTLRVCGIIYISGETISEDQILDVPTVYIDREPRFVSHGKDYVLIQSDNMQGAYLGTEHMIKLGCKHLAMIGYKPEVSSHASRIEGYHAALEAYGLEDRGTKLVYASQNRIESGISAARELFESAGDVDGILCTTDILAYGAMQYVLSQGLQIPEQVKIVGFDDLTYSSLEAISLTTLRQRISDFSELSTELLLSMIDGENLEKKHYTLSVELKQRNTG